jgi:hypothetical protein
MNVLRKIEARSCNHCCSGKAISITYCKCVSATLIIHHAMRVGHIAICDVHRSNKVFHMIS